MFLPKMSVYRWDFDEIKNIYFLVKDNELLEKYNETWKTVRNSIEKNLIVNLYTMKNV